MSAFTYNSKVIVKKKTTDDEWVSLNKKWEYKLRVIGSGTLVLAYGYTSGGYSSTNVIDKFSFGSNNNATDFGDLTVARSGIAGQQGVA